MTTAGPTSTATRPDLSSWSPAVVPAWLGVPSRWLSAVGLAAALIGSQTMAASTPLSSDVRLLLPSEGLLAGLGDGLRRGYGLAMEHSRSCGTTPPSLQLGWLPPGTDPQPLLNGAPRSELLVAPPAAPLAAYGQLADQRRLSVLLPLQRGSSLDGLPRLKGADRLWPIVPARSLEADRLAEGLLADGIRRVMVVRDPSADSRALSERFLASYSNGRGVVIGPTGEPISVNADDAAAVEQLISDVDWYRPPALVVLTGPAAPWPADCRKPAGPMACCWPGPSVCRHPWPMPSWGLTPRAAARPGRPSPSASSNAGATHQAWWRAPATTPV